MKVIRQSQDNEKNKQGNADNADEDDDDDEDPYRTFYGILHNPYQDSHRIPNRGPIGIL